MSSVNPRVGFVSLGCPKALVDSEQILTQLRAEGYVVAPDYASSDLVIVNTCGFINDAVEESLQAIDEALAENGKVVVTGCLGAKREQLRSRFPDLLAITGPQDYEAVMGAVHEYLPRRHDPFYDLVPPQGVKLTPSHYAYLKIAEGCNHSCTFCIIPSMRGKLVSRPIDNVLAEAERLVDAGVKELLVISQDTSAYGTDLAYAGASWRGRDYATRLDGLAQGLGELGVWVRLHYVYPYPHVDAIIPYMAEGKLLPYLDVPFQHASARILKLMKRPAVAERNLERIRAWRAVCPELTVRSTFIVGFPGETEAEFSELLDFLDEAQLDRVGCFPYSAVAGAAANALPDAVAADVVNERQARFMETQTGISARRLAAKRGSRVSVLVDVVDADQVVGRSYADAPEIDGQVYIDTSDALETGDLVEVEITDSSDHDLWGVLVS